MAEHSPRLGCPDRYPSISSYAFLSDSQTAALVTADGAIEWLCAPRFDGPSVFAAILDRERGGAFRLEVQDARQVGRRYLDGTLVLETRFESDAGAASVFDFLSLDAEGRHGPGEIYAHGALVCLVRCDRGTARMRASIDARPDYARSNARWCARDGFLSAPAPGTRLWASSDRELAIADGELVASFELQAGEDAAFALRYAGEPIGPIESARAAELLAETVGAWRAWSGRCAYSGTGAGLVMRSALVLKGLAFEPSGAMVAAPTTSLPEGIGGVRNWDYRFTWLRDASLTLLALLRLDYDHEAHDYMEFLLAGCSRCGEELSVMLGIDGRLELPEAELGHLEGYACSRPVRTGNAAAEQHQLDSYGGVLDSALVYQQATGALGQDHWPLLCSLVDYTCAHWTEPDNGVWEVRGPRRHFTDSKLMSWVCLDRGLRLADLLGADAPLVRWQETREEIRSSILEHGYDEQIGAFVQAYGSRTIDASALRVPLVGFLPGDDPRVISTIERVVEELEVGDSLLLRYRQEETDDGLPGGEAAFAICSFWLVSALALAGRDEEADRRFAALCERAGPLGLYAEELAPDGTMLGNFPQAFTHLALIQAALNVESRGDREALRAWAERRPPP